MKPIKTDQSNFTYTGGGDVMDLPCERARPPSAA